MGDSRRITDVIILGAGASKAAGCPLLNDFMDKAEAIYWKKTTDVPTWEKAPHFNKVLQLIRHFRSIYMSIGLNTLNIEELYGLVETDDLIGMLQRVKNADKTERFHNIKDSLNVVIAETISQCSQFYYDLKGTTGPRSAVGVVSHQSYRDFAAGIKRGKDAGRRYAIISFNYNLEVEVALHELGIDWRYCHDGVLHGMVIPLLKLHGSLNWFPDSRLPHNKEPLVVEVKEIIAGEVLKHNQRNPDHNPKSLYLDCAEYLPIEFDQLTSLMGQKAVRAPVIVPPQLNKGPLQQLVSPVWRAAATAISEAKHIHVTGYSYPPSDNFFRYLFGLGLNASDTFLAGLHVYDPNEETIARFRKMLGRGLDSRFYPHSVYFHQVKRQGIEGPLLAECAVTKIFPGVEHLRARILGPDADGDN